MWLFGALSDSRDWCPGYRLESSRPNAGALAFSRLADEPLVLWESNLGLPKVLHAQKSTTPPPKKKKKNVLHSGACVRT